MNDSQEILTGALCALLVIIFICPLFLCLVRVCNNQEIQNKQMNSGDEETHTRQFSHESENPIWRDYDTERNYVRFEDQPQIVD